MLCHAMEGDVAQYRQVTIVSNQEAPHAKATSKAPSKARADCKASASH
jgi:hypothetical protein